MKRKPFITSNDIETHIQINNDSYSDGRYLDTPEYPLIGIMVHSTATPGVSARSFATQWDASYRNGDMNQQVSVNAFIDDKGIIQTMPWLKRTWHAGGSANNNYMSFEICEPDETTFLIKPTVKTDQWNSRFAVESIQTQLKLLGYYDGQVDGSYGPKSESAVKKYQLDNQLTPDGIVGRITWDKLSREESSVCRYDANDPKTKEYFEIVYNNSVNLCSYLCWMYDINPENIISHAEGHKLGIASNHSDVSHWFPHHNKNMDIFRRDVTDKLNVAIENEVLSHVDESVLSTPSEAPPEASADRLAVSNLIESLIKLAVEFIKNLLSK